MWRCCPPPQCPRSGRPTPLSQNLSPCAPDACRPWDPAPGGSAAGSPRPQTTWLSPPSCTVRRWCKSPLLPQRSRETTGSGRRRPQSPLFVRGRKRPTPGHPALRPPRPILCCISSAFPPFLLDLFYQTGWGGFNPSLLLQSPCKGGDIRAR